ncbi:MAG TPA: aldo/keto reductase, partial [Terriglobales bacterium]|nr:aldo/keto reductase [Terriglobales bacterium]
MRYRKLGRTAYSISEIGFGAWGIGGKQWLGGEDQAAIRALQKARDLGINFYDTALAYGDGHSEQLIGQAFGKSSDIIIASKVPPKNRVWPASGSIREV